MPDEVIYINEYLDRRYRRICRYRNQITVGEFAHLYNEGTYLVTMNGHITCIIDGVIWDTFDCSDRLVWDVFLVD